jgi:hypothetical protein
MTVNVTNTSGSTAFLNVWIDFNRNGVLTDAGEQVAVNTTISNGTSNSNRTINFTVPAGAFQGNTAARVRLTSTSSPGPTGASGNGEVEDHLVRTCPLMVVCPAVSILPVGTVGSAYSLPISALGGSGGFVFAVTSGSAPAGLTLNASTGLLSGTPTTVQTRTFAVTATDSSGCTISRNYTMSIVGAGSTIQVYGEAGTNNVPITAASYVVNGTTRVQSSDQSGSSVAVNTNSAINLSTLTLNDNGESKTLNVVNLNGGSVSNVTVSASNGSFGVLLNGTATSIASSGLTAFQNSAAQISTNNNLNHYIFDDRGEGEPDGTGEYDIRFNYAFTAEDYVVCQERFGNSHIQLQALDATGNIIPGSRTVQVRGTHDWNTGYASASYISDQPYFLTVIRHGIFGTPLPIFGFRLSVAGADCKFFGMSDNPFTDNPTNAGVVGDKVWNDVNKNGIQDSGESGVSGVTVRLLNAATSDTVATTTTNSSGIYNFTAVAPGDYRVEFVAPFNHAFTSKDLGGDDRLDSDADTSTGRSDIFTMLPCDSISYIDAGVFVLSTTDFGDYSAFGSASSTVASGLRIGALLDTESVAVTNITANGDDTTGSDDEDGVTIPATLVMGDPASITVNVTNTSGASAYLNAWIDYNRNGVLTDAGEQIATNTLVANGTSGSNRVISFTVPEITPTGAVALRVRLTSTSNPGSTGQSGTGEVEDHMVTLACPLITISPTTPAQATAGLNYSQTLTQSGGHGTITWSVPGGGLPAGITLHSGTGVLSGIATTEGSYPFTVWASDGAGCSGSRAMTLVVGTMLDRGDYAGFGSATQTANTTLRIGTAATDVDVSALTNAAATSDDTNGTDDEDLTMPSLVIGSATTLNVPVTATPASLSGSTARLNVFVDWNGDGDASDAGETQAVQTVTASGTYAFSLTPPAGTTPGTKYLRLRVTEGSTAPAFTGNSTLKGEVEDYAITVGCQAMTVGPVSLGTATLGTAYTQTFTQSGANGTVTWSLAGGSLPAGLTLDTTRGILSGTATVALATSFTIRATDAAGCTATRGYTLIPVCAAVSISPESLARGTTGVSYSQALSAAPSATYSWKVVAGTLPAGLSLNSANGVLSGLPTTAGDHTFTVKASTGAASTPELEFTIYNLDLNPGDTFNIRDYVRPKDGSTRPIDWSAVRFTYTEAGANDPTTPANWNLAAFNAGQFVTVTSADAVAGGNSGAGSFRIYLVRDGQVDFDDHMEIRVDASRQSVVNSAKASPLIAYACSGTREYTLQVCPALVLSPTTLSSAMVGNAYSESLSTSGSAGPFVYEITAGSLPTGLSLNAGSGLISGTPTSTTSASFTISSTNSAGCSISRAYTLAPLPNTDFGDFSTFGSASSTFNNGLKIGALLDTEVSATTNTAATGDDITGSDDEDGVTVPASITAGSTVTIPVVVTNTTGSAASLNAWIDFNNNGSLIDAGEQIAVNLSIAAGSTNVTQNITVNVPVGASVGAGRGARFRLTSTASPGATGASGQGEVEDYTVTIAAPTLDFGDFNLFSAASSTANNNLRLGASVDAEGAATTNPTATGDDITGTDDENGVTVPAAITQGTATSLTVNVTNTIGTTAFLNAWIDFNGNGVLTDAGEQIATNTSVANATSNSNRTVSFTVPAVVKTGTVGVRVRITNVSSPGPDGQDGNGEVEDYTTSITANTDFGDYSLFTSASSKTNATLRIGALTDSEGGLETNAGATTDDLTDSDDEDGVTLLAELPQGAVGSITVNTTNTSGSSAFLNAWIDFNRNGVLTDAGEQIVTNTSITTGTSNTNQVLSFNVPGAASLGRAGVRVRLTSVSSPGPDGLDGNGEVEDHTTMIVLATTDFGDALNLADASSTANTNLRLGALVDVEGAPTKTANADGDDNTGSDDEDGLSFPSVTAGQPVALPVSVSNISGSAGYLNAWIDYNNNGILTDAGEQVATNVLVPTGTSNGTQVLNFNIPTNAVTAATSLATRFRITNIQNPGPTGHAGTGEVEDHPIIILAPLTDFGDHSDYADVSNTASTNLRLGALVDTEYASTRNVNATGDDVTGNDDEDGVTIPAMTAGAPATIPVTVTNNTGASAFLNAWIDYNDNGVFGDPGEQIATNTPIANLSTNVVSNLNITVPATATTAASLGVRVRLTALSSPGATGAGGLGEVEDYAVTIAAPTTDFGDFTGFGSASSSRNASLRLGALLDTEFAQTANATATGDDITGSDDEDAVTFPSMTSGAPATIPVLVTNTSGAAAFLHAWIDYNNNGTLEAGEQIATNVSIATGSNNITQNLSITVPAGALTGVSLGARFRLTSTSGVAATGLVGNGEVEDHIVTISAPTTDFGDHSSFADASQGANPFLRLGSLIDTEFVSTRNATATGDDITGGDDEDGVVVPAMIAGQTVTIPVTISNSTGANGFLNAWIDFNNNGVLTDSGEQVASNILIATGAVNAVTNLSVTVPPTAATGVSLGLRFRLSAPSGLGPTGANGLAGEIEDYAVTIAAPTTDFGDHSGLSAASSTVNANLLMGTTSDAEFTATTNITATGDDTTGLDDEDGVVVPASLVPATTAVLPVTVRNATGANAWLHAWIDFNNDGVLNNATISSGGERLEAARLIAPLATGSILREFWTGISGISVSDLTSHASYPNSPNGSDLRSNFTAPTDWADNMGQRMRGWIYPPVSGEYTFWVSGDDESQLFLSTDATSANSALIARVPSWTSPLIWTTFPEQKSVKITLEAGKPYYIEALMKEGGGGDNLAVAWELPGTSTGPVVIAGQYLSPWSVNPPFNDTQQISFTVPLTVNPGANRAVRFRLTDSSTTTATGASGIGEVEDYAVLIAAATNDFGDWSGAASASNGVNNSLRLGATVDAEYFATTNATATGDDITGTDDEDGVTLPALTAGGVFTVPVTVTNLTGAAATLNAWIDFNNNGVFTDSGENVIVNLTGANGSNGVVLNPSITVPTTAVTGTNVGARFRLTSTASPGATGNGGGVGEVEDCVVNIAAPTTDFGDYSSFAAASSTANTALRMGALVDAEFTATSNLAATGDDTTGADDEDGVTLPSMMAGAPATVPVIVTNSTAASAYLNAWIDFNNNGVLTDAGEQVATNVLVSTATTNATRNLSFTVPPAAVTGASLGVRVRLTSTSSPGATGPSGSGEVEDYVTTISPPPLDFGDWSGLADAASTVTPGLRLGTLADTEFASTRNSTASGDDNTELDDEDGVTFTAMTAGAPASIAVNVTNTTASPAYLNAWFDFNNNNSVADAGEQIATNTLVAAGTNNATLTLNLTIPANAVTGASLGTRFRLTSQASPGVTGTVGLGEVEDHAANIAVPVTDFGDWSGAADASNLASSDLRMGALADTEFVPTKNATASGDDTTGSDDEDGVLLPVLLPGTASSASVVVTNNSGAAGYLNAWIDFNNNGSFADAGEQIATNILFAHGTNGVTQNIAFNTPVNAIPGNRGARFRLTAAQNPTSIGAGGLGEVEDHTVSVSCVPFSINPASMPAATVGVSFSQALTNTGIHGPVVYQMTNGALPAGLVFNSGTGVISGTPTSSAAANFTITATDANGCTAVRGYAITPNCPAVSITPSSINPGLVGSFYSQTFTATGGMAPHGSWTVASGTLPTGLSLNPTTGVLSGTPSNPGLASFTVRVNDASLVTTVAAPSSPVSAPSYNQSYVDAVTGTNAFLRGGNWHWRVSAAADAHANDLYERPTAQTYAQYAEGYATAGVEYFGNLDITEGLTSMDGKYAYFGIRLYSRDKVTTDGTQTAEGLNYQYGIRLSTAADSRGGLLIITDQPESKNGTNWGGNSLFVYRDSNNDLNINGNGYESVIASDGKLGGSGAVIAFSRVSPSNDKMVEIAIDYAALGFTRAQIEALGRVVFEANKGTKDPGNYLWNKEYTGAQAGSPNGGSGGLSEFGTSGLGNVYELDTLNGASLTVPSSQGCQGTRDYTVRICPVITISPTSLAACTVGAAYNQVVTASGGASPVGFAVSSGNLPAGLSLDPNTGVISGTPTNTVAATFTIRATDANGCSGTRNYSLTPTCPALVLAPAALPIGYLGAAYTPTLSINGGTAPHSFSIQSGSLPSGVSLSPSGVFSGTPTAVGAFNLVLRATDFYGCTRTFDLTLQVRTLSLGNLIFEDANRNSLKDAGEQGVAEALVQLFATGNDNAIGGSGAAADTRVGSNVTTGSTGDYLFADLPAGNYYVKVTPPVDYVEAGGTASVLDNNINDNNDGSQPGGPGTPLYSPVVNLTGGAESITDGDADADTNLSIDFGLWGSVAVGNFVFLDINGDGVRNEGESLGNIFVELYAQGTVPGVDEPIGVGSSGCSCKGRYYIEGLNPGNYFLHIPAGQFAAGMALEGLLPMSVAVPGDDNVGQDLLFNNNPAINGASTAVFTLRPGLCPVGSAESGGEGTLDDEIDARVDLTRDLGLVAPAGSGFAAGDRARRWLVTDETSGTVRNSANSFASWSQSNALGGPNEDADADGLSNLLEYAFGTDPFSPLHSNHFSLTHESAGVVANITQPLVSRDDLIVRLETLTDLAQAADPAAWKTLNLASTTTINGGDTLTRHYSGLERLLVFKDRDIGFIRLKVSLDADRNGAPEASTTTAVHAWSRQTFATGMRTFSLPLLKPAVFTGRVNSVLANEIMLSAIPTLPAASLYLEALDGALVGQRFEIDSALSSGNTLVLHDDGRSLNGLGGARVVIRAHHMLAEALPPALFTAGDRVLIFDTALNNFTPLVQSVDAWSDGALSMNSRPLAPHEAVLVDVRGESTAQFMTGEVRSDDFILPLVPGAQLISSGWPTVRPAPVTGLRSGSSPENADRLRLWNGDTSSSISGYSGYYLDQSTTPPSWKPQDAETAPLPLLPPFHGHFIIREESLLLKSAKPW